ncbi:MAG TPA: hypothetical protein PKK15_07585 [Kouleothrix sp.]|nr:hypothetical protein [Kouleothrix sp.]
MAPNNLLLREIPLKVVPLADGRFLLSVAVESGAVGGGGSGDASAANQLTQIGAEQAIQAALGAPADASASDDSGTWSLTALIKRLAGKLPPSLGQKVKTQSLPVVLPSDQILSAVPTDPAATTGTITAQDTNSTSAAGQGGQTRISGNPTAGSAVVATFSGAASFAIQVDLGSATGTVQFERSIDGGTTWVPMMLPLYGVAASSVTSVTASCVAHGSAGANTAVRVRATGAIGGTGGIAIRIQPSYGLSVVGAAQAGLWTLGQLPGTLAANGGLKIEGVAGGVPAPTQAGGYTTTVAPTITVSTSPAYSAGDLVGGKLTLPSIVRTSGGTALLQSLLLRDTSNQKAALELIIFDSDPSSTTFTDNGALSIHANDAPKIIRRISIAASDYVTIGTVAYADVGPIGKVLKSASGVDLYACLVAPAGSTPTYATTAALSLAVGALQD